MKESCHSQTNFKEWFGLFNKEMFRFVGKILFKCILFRKVNFALNCMKYHFSWQQMWYLILIFLSLLLFEVHSTTLYESCGFELHYMCK